MLILETPVRVEGDFGGVLFVVVALGQLAEFLADLSERDSVDAFILYGDDKVLAHPSMFNRMFKMAPIGEIPLPNIDMFADDPALSMLDNGALAEIDPMGMESKKFSGIVVNDDVVVLIRDHLGLGPEPWRIGFKVDRAKLNAPLIKLRQNAAIGILILIAAMIAALIMGRHMTVQIPRIASYAARLSRLEIVDSDPLPDSRYRELSVAAKAFNQMSSALKWFETYVPKPLVMRLMGQSEETDVTTSRERMMTVMFTDIRGFSTLAEHMQAGDIAALLNEHFELLSNCIQTEGGTVDKFIGDSVMAFWGAPENMPDHAERTVRAARAIQIAVLADNEKRRLAGDPVVAIRIGIHTGPVVVGNIGSSSGVNYTVVGDTVNATSRIEALSKDLGLENHESASECFVLLSETTIEAIDDQSNIESLGPQVLRGRSGEIEVFRLVPGH